MNNINIVIWGTGRFGIQAYEKYKDRVVYFIDNNEKLWGKMIDEKPIKQIQDYISEGDSYHILIACKDYVTVEKQLKEHDISNYSIYLKDRYAYFYSNEVVYNPYVHENNRDLNECEWNENITKNDKIKRINEYVEKLSNENNLFEHIEIETVNRCNGVCSFCPVSKNRDPREYCEMTDNLFASIITQLGDMDYKGRLALFSNNEPLLDSKIIERHAYARKMVPNARMHLFTNGTLLTLDIFLALMKYLDELIIDNYHQELKLIKPCEEIVNYCSCHEDMKNKVTIVLRKPNEILTTRGGDAPNRKEMCSYPEAKCVLPFKQMIIRPDGKVSLCCNDPLGKNTLADLNKESLLEAWTNPRFEMVRKCLAKSRTEWSHCVYCDTLSLG